ncbi:MAG: hypothetical protein ABIW32_06590 [Terrimesophilobacter sp.]
MIEGAMADDIDFSVYAGKISFPRDPSDLTSTSRCPACFTELTSTVCSACGLDVGTPAASDLHATSLAAAAALEKRLAIIGKIRYETKETAESIAKEREAVRRELDERNARADAALDQVVKDRAQEYQAAAAASMIPSAIPAPPEPRMPSGIAPLEAPLKVRKYSTVQITMLVVGVSLLVAAAIYFLIFAYITFGIIWQSVIIAGITVALIAAATLLRRRRLPASAEAIAAAGVALVYLDAYAIRANNLFNTEDVEGFVYWGAAILLIAVAFKGWSRLSSLRTPSIAGFASFAPGVGVLVAGISRDSEPGTHMFLTAASIAVAGLIHRWALTTTSDAHSESSGRGIERIATLSTSALALVWSFGSALTVAPTSDWAGTLATLAIAVVASVHLWALEPRKVIKLTRPFAFTFSAMVAIFAASAFSFAALRIDTVMFWVLLPVITAVIVALVFDAVSLLGPEPWRTLARVGAWCAAGVFALTLVLPIFIAVRWTVLLPSIGLSQRWNLDATSDASVAVENPGWAILGLTIVGIVVAVSWTLSKVIRTRGLILAVLGACIAITAATLPSILWVTVAGWLAIAVAAIAMLNVSKVRALSRGYRIVLGTTATVSGLFAYAISWASLSTWWVATIVVIGLLLASRRVVARSAAKAAMLAGATIVALVGSNAAALHLTYDSGVNLMTNLDLANGFRFASIAALALFALFAMPRGRTVTTTDRRVMFWLTGATFAISHWVVSTALSNMSEAGRLQLLLPEYSTSLIVHLGCVAALVVWIAAPTTSKLSVERIAASMVTAPATYLAIIVATKVATLPEFVLTIAPIAAALIVAAAALILSIFKPTSTPRWALDTGVVLVALPSVLFAIVGDQRFAWFVLVLAAVTTLFLAIGRDGLFASKSPRKHLGWLAIALAISGLWWRLGSSQVGALEPYVLPLTGVLLATAARVTPSRSAGPLVALGGLLVSLLPLGLNAITGSLTRAIVVASISAALLLLGSFVVTGRKLGPQADLDADSAASADAGFHWQPWLDTAVLAGALGLIVTAIGRGAVSKSVEWSGDVWLAAALIVLIGAGIGQMSGARARTGGLRAASSQALAIIALSAVIVIEVGRLATPLLDNYRALGLVVLFATVTTLCFSINRAPFGRTVGLVSTAYWAIATIAIVKTFPRDPLLMLAPVVSALLVAAITLAVAMTRSVVTPRWMRDLGIILVVAFSVFLSVALSSPQIWLVLLLSAVVILLLAIDKDGLFSSTSGRRQLGWVSLALATAGLWWRLFGDNVTELEPYVLPVAGTLITIALLLERARQKNAEDPSSASVAPFIGLGGLLVAILPLSVNVANGDQGHAIIIGAVCAALLLAGSFVISSPLVQRWWDSAAIAGGIGVIVLMIGRAIHLPIADGTRDAWVLGGFALLLAAAFGQALPRNVASDRARSLASQAFGLVAMAAALALEVPGFLDSPAGQIRALGLVGFFAAVHVIALWLQRAPFSPLVGWIAIAFAAIAGGVGINVGAIETPEFATVPIAVVLLTTGAVRLTKVATSGSWPWLAPGLVVLLLPTLIQNLQEPELWRIVGLGVVAVAVLVVGILHKLQSPFVFGATVALIHGVATFLPQLRAAYEFVPWWLWLGLGGVALIAGAIRYEQRIRDMKKMVMKFAELR